MENIQQVEICRYDYYTGSTTQIYSMDKETALALLNDISALKSYRAWGDYSRDDYGEIVIYITYENGEAEVIGMCNTASVDTDEEWWIKSYYFDSQEWCTVLLKYVDQSLVPELEKYFEGH